MLQLLLAMQVAAAQPAPIERDAAELKCVLEIADGVKKLAGIEAFHLLADGPSSPFGVSAMKTMINNRDKCGEKFTWNDAIMASANGYMMSDLAASHMISVYREKGVSFKEIDEMLAKVQSGEAPPADIKQAITTLAAGLRAQGLNLPVGEAEDVVSTYMGLIDFRYFTSSTFVSGEGTK